MWLWHVPALYDAALGNDAVHALEHLTFGAAGLLYWWHLLSPIRSRMRLGGLGPSPTWARRRSLVGLLGIVLAFSPERPVRATTSAARPAGASSRSTTSTSPG